MCLRLVILNKIRNVGYLATDSGCLVVDQAKMDQIGKTPENITVADFQKCLIEVAEIGNSKIIQLDPFRAIAYTGWAVSMDSVECAVKQCQSVEDLSMIPNLHLFYMQYDPNGIRLYDIKDYSIEPMFEDIGENVGVSWAIPGGKSADKLFWDLYGSYYCGVYAYSCESGKLKGALQSILDETRKEVPILGGELHLLEISGEGGEFV